MFYTIIYNNIFNKRICGPRAKQYLQCYLHHYIQHYSYHNLQHYLQQWICGLLANSKLSRRAGLNGYKVFFDKDCS